MTLTTTAYRLRQQPYDPDVETIPIEDIAYELCDGDEVREFLTRNDPNRVRWAVIWMYERGQCTAGDAVAALVRYGFLSPEDMSDAEIHPDGFLKFYVAREKARANGAAA